MTLKVIGSGLGRTGTLSLKGALEQLGFGPCHHMAEVFANPQSVPWWIEAVHGKADWDKIYAGFESTVDYPGAAFWRELIARYPDAKVLHSVRDPDKWFDSTQATIFAPGSLAVSGAGGPMAEFFSGVSRTFGGGDMHDRAFMTDFFRKHTEAVKAAVPAERLLVYEVGQGWAPLCEFLGVPVPDTPFPQVNSREEFQARASRRDALSPDEMKAEMARMAKGQ
jgi:hypothetical protein